MWHAFVSVQESAISLFASAGLRSANTDIASDFLRIDKRAQGLFPLCPEMPAWHLSERSKLQIDIGVFSPGPCYLFVRQ